MNTGADDVLLAWGPTLRGNPAGQGPGSTFRPPPRPAAPPAIQAGLDLLEPVGEGGMAVVYRARQRALQRAVAVKQVRAELGPDAEGRFLAEALTTARLDHPNVVPVHDLVEVGAGGQLALSMKLVRGRGWDRLLHPADGADRQAAEQLDTESHLEILVQVANAVGYAHSRGIAHCDLKPANVMVGAFGEVQVMDWGLAVDFRERADRELGDEQLPHKSGLVHPCGTPRYMPPELALGRGDRVGPWTDVFLLGAILHEVLTGAPPNAGGSLEEILQVAARGVAPSLPDSVPPALRSLCVRALCPDIGGRVGTAAQFLEELRGWLKHRESLALTAAARAVLGREGQATDGAARYEAIAGAIAACRQARVLWEQNPEAPDLEVAARGALCAAALGAGDLALAREQLGLLPGGSAPRERLAPQVASAEQRLRRAAQLAWWTRMALYAASACVAGALVAALVGWRRLRAQEQVLAEVADTTEVDALLAEPLPPALPGEVPGMERSLRRAHAVLEGRAAHEDRISELVASPPGAPPGSCPGLQGLPRLECALRLEHLARLRPLSEERVPQLEARLAFARGVEQRTLVEPADRWRAAVRAVSSPSREERSAPYRDADVALVPQLGLVPLGPDPDSGLEEFVHLQSGTEPSRRGGVLEITEDSGVVLVLLPGGTFQMGSSPLPGPNRDVDAVASAAPVHGVTLAPFFMAKYELTQAQHLRAAARNPSAYPVGWRIGSEQVGPLNPVEQLTWEEAEAALSLLGLRLPTEAQWEYAARGGTQTAYWWGDSAAAEDLKGRANLADEGSRALGPASWSYVRGLSDGRLLHAPVGSYRANPFGLHDAVGNVWEWCRDVYRPYTAPVEPGSGLRTGPAVQAEAHVFRGGGFRASPVHLKSGDRYPLYSAGYRAADVGIRAALPLRPAGTVARGTP